MGPVILPDSFIPVFCRIQLFFHGLGTVRIGTNRTCYFHDQLISCVGFRLRSRCGNNRKRRRSNNCCGLRFRSLLCFRRLRFRRLDSLFRHRLFGFLFCRFRFLGLGGLCRYIFFGVLLCRLLLRNLRRLCRHSLLGLRLISLCRLTGASAAFSPLPLYSWGLHITELLFWSENTLAFLLKAAD